MGNTTKIGLGITTFNRPDYFAQTIQGVIEHLLDAVDVCYVYNDGSAPEHTKAYQDIYATLPAKIKVVHAKRNKGVAHAKNVLLKHLIDQGCGWLFVLEDDVVPQSRKAITHYIAAAKMSGISHLSFAHHGPLNQNDQPLAVGGPIALWPHAVGAYCMYTSDVIKTVGYFDENFKNAVEHIEHTFRITMANFHPTLDNGYADVLGSQEWLKEIPGSIEHSSIRANKGWDNNVIEGLRYWKRKDPLFPFNTWLEMLEEDQQNA